MTEARIFETTDQFHLDVYNRLPVVLVKGKGARVWASDGTEYIDALAGIAVNNIGHCHPRVVDAVKEQAETLMHISNLYYSEPQARLLELLAHVSKMDRIFLCNSGAEAVEGTIKLARKYGSEYNKKGPIITVTNAFHGRTIGAISMGMNKYQAGFDPLLSGFAEIPFNNVDALKKTFNDETPGIIFEPVQGNGGLEVASSEFMHTVEALCHEYGALFMLDEVQTGFGRTGAMFCYEHYGVQPDIIASAKALGGGFPVGAVLASERAASCMTHGDHGSTFGGNPMACAAARAALKVLQKENLAELSKEKGAYLVDKLTDGLRPVKQVIDIRGRGLMIGVELTFKGSDVVNEMMRNGVLSNCISGNILRLLPPLVITQKELDILAETLINAVKTVASVKQ